MAEPRGPRPDEPPETERSTAMALSEIGGPNSGGRGVPGRGPMVLGLGLTALFVAVMVLAAVVALVVALI